MPDKRKHRGRHPEDERLFAPGVLAGLRSAVLELSWLLSRGYAERSALKLVGDRHDLTARQRMAIWRAACPDAALHERTRRCASAEQAVGQALGIDGYNVLITVESALSGGLVVVGRDGCCRDLASIHGTYHRVEETVPALELITSHVMQLGMQRVDWYLDQPVSNSGRLKKMMGQVLEQHGAGVEQWHIKLVHNPDDELAQYDGVVASSDSFVLDRATRWINLARDIIDEQVPGAWRLDLRD